jgi:hypothetical protein
MLVGVLRAIPPTILAVYVTGMVEAKLILDRHVLIRYWPSIAPDTSIAKKLETLLQEFCGRVYCDSYSEIGSENNAQVFFSGDFEAFQHVETKFEKTSMKIIRDLCVNYDGAAAENLVNLDEVPVQINQLAVCINNYFGAHPDMYDNILTAHRFQTLNDASYRKGVLLSHIDKLDGKALEFILMRCSTDFQGPTESFAEVDQVILDGTKNIGALFFRDGAQPNHILAQMYENIINSSGKDKKAKISSHADKTKDMPTNGMIAFCTFYCNKLQSPTLEHRDGDYFHKGVSVLSKLRFRLKRSIQAQPDLLKTFEVTLYPNSLLMIPLSTNRLYTHEIVPSQLSANLTPTRIGYVVRTSKSRAVFQNNSTYIRQGNELDKMRKPTDADRQELKDLYLKENLTDDIVDYGHCLYSFNSRDYLEPSIKPSSEHI